MLRLYDSRQTYLNVVVFLHQVSQQINYAHNLYEEQLHTLTSTEPEENS